VTRAATGTVGEPQEPARIDSRAPDFFIVGHPKSGTTALYRMLRSHPQVFMPALKEPLFFDRELHPDLTPKGPHPGTLEEYLQLFAAAQPGQIKGEASVNYLRSREAARRIAAVQPRARSIAVLREPAEFMRSLHLQLLQSGIESETDMRRAIERERREAASKPVLRYADDRFEYVAQLRRYEQAFGAERVLALVYDDFRADNAATMRRVLEFLELDPEAPLEPAEANPTVFVRAPRVRELVRSLALGDGPATRAAGGAIKTLVPPRLRRSALGAVSRRTVQAQPPPADERLMLELRRRYKHEVEALAAHLGRDLVAEWGYDRLG
jgi:hypothetical protein